MCTEHAQDPGSNSQHQRKKKVPCTHPSHPFNSFPELNVKGRILYTENFSCKFRFFFFFSHFVTFFRDGDIQTHGRAVFVGPLDDPRTKGLGQELLPYAPLRIYDLFPHQVRIRNV